MNIPQLDTKGKRVLQVIKDRGVVTGNELAAEAINRLIIVLT